MLADVARFAQQVIAPHTLRPEHPMEAGRLAETLAAAERMGLCGGGEVTGLAPWDHLGERLCVGPTLEVLMCLGEKNAGVALAVHHRALARALARAANLRDLGAAPVAIAPQGRHGLGRTALARLLAGVPLGDDDRALLADVYAADATFVIPAEPDVTALLAPWYDGETLRWRLCRRADLDVVEHGHAHGLDELRTIEVRARGQAWISAPALALTASVLAAHQLALVAVAAGAVSHAHELARRYAATRRQGGGTIDRHPAVLGLLARIRATLASVRARLAGWADAPGLDALAGAAAWRCEAHPALCDAANAALQVFGGAGYLRDGGLEKVVRDVNHLRALAGNPRELELFVAEWERLHA